VESSALWTRLPRDNITRGETEFLSCMLSRREVTMAEANITQRRVGELMRGVFKILLDHAEGLPAKEILERMKQDVPPTDFEKSDYPNKPGVQRFGKMIRFATIAPVKAGRLIKEKGKWYLTEEGKKAFRDYPDPTDFRQESRPPVGSIAVSPDGKLLMVGTPPGLKTFDILRNSELKDEDKCAEVGLETVPSAIAVTTDMAVYAQLATRFFVTDIGALSCKTRP
jgi:hypothetical protein